MYEQRVQNEPTAAYILSLLGGIFALIGGVALLILGAFVGVFTFGFGLAVIGGIGVWIMICAVIVIYSASQLKAHPLEHSKWGALILIFSLIGAWSIFDFIGGILALVYSPITVGVPQQPQYVPPQTYGPPTQQATWGPQASAHTCPQCGRIVPENVRFCPNCGKQQY